MIAKKYYFDFNSHDPSAAAGKQLEKYQQTLSNYSYITENSLELGVDSEIMTKPDGYEVEFKYSDPTLGPTHEIDFFANEGSVANVDAHIQFYATDDKFETYRPIFIEMINSFRIAYTC